MRTLVALLLTIALVLGGGMVFAQRVGVSRGGFEIASDDAATPGDPTLGAEELAPFPVGPQLACTGSLTTISIADYSSFTTALTVTVQDVDNEDAIMCIATAQLNTNLTTAGNVAGRIRVRDNDGTIFYADPDPAGNSYYMKTATPAAAKSSFDYHSGTWFINPASFANFDLGNVSFDFQLTEAPSGSAQCSFRSLCCLKVKNVPTVDPDGAINVGPQ